MNTLGTNSITHWWAGASYGAKGAWAHVPNEDVAPWMLLMVIVFGLIYVVDAVVASIAVLTTLRDPPVARSRHEHSHDNLSSDANAPFAKSTLVGTTFSMSNLQLVNLSKRNLGTRP